MIRRSWDPYKEQVRTSTHLPSFPHPSWTLLNYKMALLYRQSFSSVPINNIHSIASTNTPELNPNLIPITQIVTVISKSQPLLPRLRF